MKKRNHFIPVFYLKGFVDPHNEPFLWQYERDCKAIKKVTPKNIAWRKYLRAPKIFFKILEKGKGKLIPLKKIADIRRGFTTGADPWFYVSDLAEFIGIKEIKQIAKNMGYKGNIENLRYIQSGDGTRWLVEKEYLHPVVRNPKDYKSIFIDINSVKDFVIYLNEVRDKIKNKLIKKYVLHGEKKTYKMGKNRNLIPAKTETCLSRVYWYKLPIMKPACLLWQKAFDVYHRHYLLNKDVLANQRFYLVYPKDNEDTKIIAAFMNSSIIIMFLEFQRTVMGLGAIEATVKEVKQVLVIDPKRVKGLSRPKLILSVFGELGTKAPEEVSLDKVKPDRRELDKIIMGEILGLTDEEQLEVYRAVIDLVKSRIEKAKSFGKKKKTKGGIDINALVKAVMNEIGEETLGKFYKEKILNQKSHKSITLPNASGKVNIEGKLFNKWMLSIGKEHIECDSEEEARYLKIFVGTGLSEVKIPTDKNYIKNILPELEKLKLQAEKVINSYLESIVDKKTRETLRHSIWAEVMSEKDSVK